MFRTQTLCALATLMLAISTVAEAEPPSREPPGNLSRVVLQDGTTVVGILDAEGTKLSTPFGQLTFPAEKIRKREPVDPLTPYYLRGEVDGEYTEFVEELPERVASHFHRNTWGTNTIGPQDERHASAPWLYPIAGRGELPRIFVQQGEIHYPVLGAWRSVWSDRVHYYDENHQLLKPDEHLPGPHTATNVDYYVAPLSALPAVYLEAAGEPTSEFRVQLTDGSILFGRLREESLTVAGKWGTMTVACRDIVKAGFEQEMAGGETWFQALIHTRGRNKLPGAVDPMDLHLDSVLGELSIPLARIKSIRSKQ